MSNHGLLHKAFLLIEISGLRRRSCTIRAMKKASALSPAPTSCDALRYIYASQRFNAQTLYLLGLWEAPGTMYR